MTPQSPRRLFDLAYIQEKNNFQPKAYSQRESEIWKSYSSSDIVQLSRSVAAGLINLGIQPGEKVGMVVAENQVEWLVTDLGIQQSAAVVVPVYSTISNQEFVFIFNHAEIRYLFCGTKELYHTVSALQDQIPGLQKIFCFQESEDTNYWKSMFGDPSSELIDTVSESIQTEDLSTIIYTSGTTGVPKGVMLSHFNILSNIHSVRSLLPLHAGHRTLSFLPLCHIFEKVKTYVAMDMGLNVHYVGIDNLGGEDGDLVTVKPHFFTTVPRLLEKVFDRIYQKGMNLSWPKKPLFFWALKLTDKYYFDYKPSGLEALKWKIADKLIFSKWRKALGGELIGVFTGAAACPEKIVRVFSAAGIPIREGYGLTEASPGITVNHYEAHEALLGTVGKAVLDVSVTIDTSDGIYAAGEGEILAAGPNIMMGYYKALDKTEEVIRVKDGVRWLLTGDIGKMVVGPNGGQFLKITDRKKELFKTSGGKYVAPAPIEAALKEDFLVDNIMLVGDDRKFVSALIVPSLTTLKTWCQQNGISADKLTDIVLNTKVKELYQDIINRFNPRFNKVEQIKKFVLVTELWEASKPDGSLSELTPTLKLKRRVILEKYKDLIATIYHDREDS
ncbi:MAG: long-chain fatty acid--CoA ligase [Saprospiraceae bacterium]